MQRRLLISFLGLLVLASGWSIGAAEPAKPHSAIRPVPRKNSWWKTRHEKLNARIKQGNVDLIFVGDSITQGWENNGKKVWWSYTEVRGTGL